MLFFLQLKHWQLFIFTWALASLAMIIGLFNLGLAVTLIPFVLVIGSIGFFGWIASIGIILNQRLPDSVRLNATYFKVLFIVPITYMITLICWIVLVYFDKLPWINQLDPTFIAGIIVPLHFITLLIIAWAIAFASKTIKAVELQEEVTFKDYGLEFFQIWFSIIGLWYLQPKINEMVKDLHSKRH